MRVFAACQALPSRGVVHLHRTSLGVCTHLTSLQRGYMLNERVVRAAEVGVTRAQD